MNKRVSIVIAAVIAITAVILVFSLRKGPTVPGSVVRIAGNIPLSGPTASFSGEWGNGLMMGIDDACEETGFPRKTFEIDMQDNQGQPAQAATIVQKQAITGFDVYASGTTQMTKAVAPTVDRTSALHLLVSYDAHLTGEAPNRMQILTHFKAEGPVYVEYARMRQAKRVVSLTLNVSEIQDEFSDYVEPGLKALGAGFSREIFGFDNNDFRTLALKAKQFRPDLIFVSGFSIHVLAILRALRAERMITDGNVLSIMDFNELLAGTLSTGELAGVTYIAPQLRRSKPEPKIVAFFATQPIEHLYVSAVTLAEIRFGSELVEEPNRRAELTDWLTHQVRPMFGPRVLTVTRGIMLKWRLPAEQGRKTGPLFPAGSHHRRHGHSSWPHCRHSRPKRLRQGACSRDEPMGNVDHIKPFILPHLPQNLPQHPHQYRSVPPGNIQPPHQSPHLLLRRSRGHRVDVAALPQNLQQHQRDLFRLPRRGARNRLGRRRSHGPRVARQFVQAQRHRLPQVHGKIGVHRGNAHQPMAMAQLFVRQSELLRAEQQCHRRLRQGAAEETRSIFQPSQRMLQTPMPQRRGAHHQLAIRHRVRKAGVVLGRLQQRRRPHRRARFAEGHVVSVDPVSYTHLKAEVKIIWIMLKIAAK